MMMTARRRRRYDVDAGGGCRNIKESRVVHAGFCAEGRGAAGCDTRRHALIRWARPPQHRPQQYWRRQHVYLRGKPLAGPVLPALMARQYYEGSSYDQPGRDCISSCLRSAPAVSACACATELKMGPASFFARQSIVSLIRRLGRTVWPTAVMSPHPQAAYIPLAGCNTQSWLQSPHSCSCCFHHFCKCRKSPKVARSC